MKLTRKEFISNLRKEGYNIPSQELEDLIQYYEELLDEQNLYENDIIPEKYDAKKIINDYRLETNFKKYETKTKKDFKSGLLIIILSVLSMPVLLLLLAILVPILLGVPIFIIVIIFSIIFGIIGTVGSIMFSNSSIMLMVVGLIAAIIGIILLMISAIIEVVKWLAHKFYKIVLQKKGEKR